MPNTRGRAAARTLLRSTKYSEVTPLMVALSQPSPELGKSRHRPPE
jgi:hypothetical protein